MMGIFFLPFFCTGFATPRGFLAIFTLGVLPTLITAALMGNIVDCGVAPFGPYLFVPIGIALGCGTLAAWSRWWRGAAVVLLVAEQGVVFWIAAYAPHWKQIDWHSFASVMPLVLAFAAQIAVFTILAVTAFRADAVASAVAAGVPPKKRAAG
jgi:hypothetical protein